MKKGDIVIIAVFLAVAMLGLVGVKVFAPTGNITYADIYVDEGLYEAVPLNEDTVITIDQGDGKVNYVEVKDGSIFMVDSTCADHLCVTQGAMSPDNYEKRPMLNWIICLPNRVTVELRIEQE
jgi:hypothetical protein